MANFAFVRLVKSPHVKRSLVKHSLMKRSLVECLPSITAALPARCSSMACLMFWPICKVFADRKI